MAVAACDCYVSLHRAEGFGLTMAEAMYLDRPVIATGYSGNLDFMTADNSYLVDHTLVDIGQGSDPYPADGQWAEPDVEHAARLMREVFEHPEQAAERGRAGGRDIRRTHSAQAAGEILRLRWTCSARSTRISLARQAASARGPARWSRRCRPGLRAAAAGGSDAPVRMRAGCC